MAAILAYIYHGSRISPTASVTGCISLSIPIPAPFYLRFAHRSQMDIQIAALRTGVIYFTVIADIYDPAIRTLTFQSKIPIISRPWPHPDLRRQPESPGSRKIYHGRIPVRLTKCPIVTASLIRLPHRPIYGRFFCCLQQLLSHIHLAGICRNIPEHSQHGQQKYRQDHGCLHRQTAFLKHTGQRPENEGR